MGRLNNLAIPLGLATASFFAKQFKTKGINLVAEENDYKPRILIIGGGLTGCLTSYLLKKQFKDSINLQLLEQSRYPSGRFGAGLRYNEGQKQIWCDMGSQVLSVINCEGGHENACTSGHGMYAQDLQEAWKLVKLLRNSGTITRVPNDGEDENNSLDPTEERMIFDNLWAHFWPTNNEVNSSGLSGVMRFLLQLSAPVNVEFNREVESIEWKAESKKFYVSSTIKEKESDLKDSSAYDNSLKGNTRGQIDEADIVIVTIPAGQARFFTKQLLPEYVEKDLSKIEYESRASCSVIVRMSPELAMNVSKLFGPKKVEINLDLRDSSICDADENLHLFSWQDRKYSSYEDTVNEISRKMNASNEATIDLSFTVHSNSKSFKNFKSSLDFEKFAQISLKNLLLRNNEGANTYFEILKSRGVLWKLSQPTGPMETLYKEVADQEKAYPYGSAFVNPQGLVLAGDYFTQSSYIGCFSSASAAARGVGDVLKEKFSIYCSI